MSAGPVTVGAMADAPYEIRRSRRRTRTMSAFREAGRVVVVVPEHLTTLQQRELVPDLVERFLAKERRRAAPRGDDELTRRAHRLFEAHIAPVVGHPPPAFGVRWVGNQQARWGSCTPSTGEIRISERLRDFPAWVVDYVLLHEAAHLVEREHNERFWSLVNAYPLSERARGFLEGVDFARR